MDLVAAVMGGYGGQFEWGVVRCVCVCERERVRCSGGCVGYFT